MRSYHFITYFIILLLCQAVVSAQDDYKNPLIKGLNKENPHASYSLDSDRIISLDGSWDFMYFNDPGDLQTGFYKKSFSPNGWEKTSVPSFIQRGSDEGDEAVAVYLKDTEMEIPDPGEQVILRFAGVSAAFHVWINGFKIGYSEGFGIPAEFNVTPFVVEGNNRIAVKVYSFGYSDDRFLSDRDILMGIYDHASLLLREPVHVRDLITEYWFGDSLSEVLLRMNIFIESFLQGVNVGRILDVSLLSPGGEVLFSDQRKIDFPISFRQELEMDFDYTIKAPLLWAPDDPHLYKVMVTVSEADNRHPERIQTLIGFRDVEDLDSLIILNGDTIVPEISEQYSMGYDYSLVEEDYIRFFNENASNTLKIYNPLPYRIMDICDRNGIMVWSVWPEGEALADSSEITTKLRKALEYQEGYRFGGEVNRVSVVKGAGCRASGMR